MKKLGLLSTSIAMMLAGCGGSSDIQPAASDTPSTATGTPQAGDPLYVSMKVDGQEILSETYRYYALTDSGRLVVEPKAENAQLPHIALRESRQVKAMSVAYLNAGLITPQAVDQASMVVFTEELVAAIRKHYTDASSRDAALQLGDFDMPLEDVYAEYKSSGLSSVDAFVAFFEAMDANFPDYVSAEGDIENFLDLTGMNIAAFLGVLDSKGITWPQLLAAMKAQGATFTTLYQGYASSLDSLGTFISEFVQGKTAKAASMARPLGDPVTDAAKVAVEAGKLGLDVAKFAWEIIKDARPVTKADGAYTSILSVKDKNYENYGYSVSGTSAVVDYEGKNLFTMTLFHAKFRIDGYYNAANPSVPGNWMPSVAFKVDESFAGLTWNLNAGAAITSAANLASSAAPEPEIQIVANVQANGWFQSFTNSFTFYANGRTGFRKQ
ncbi:MAG: hypothetical protein B7Y40_03825 [Gammaproteobacteria bacterium 28-57-27]|nr:MAG: hypothetical protein B7Y40_03825 [Gammaproteobacteria bacterium 28-57-27]